VHLQNLFIQGILFHYCWWSCSCLVFDESNKCWI